MNLLRSTQLISTAFAFSFLAACSDSGGGPGLPADAVVITDQNAVTIAGEAIDTTGDGPENYFINDYKSGSQTQSSVFKINSLVDKYRNLATSKGEVVAGITQTFQCFVSGQVTVDLSESTTSFYVSYNFTNCNDGYGDIVDGYMTVSLSSDGNFEHVDANMTAGISVTDIATQNIIQLTGMDLRATTVLVSGSYGTAGDWTNYANYAVSGLPFIGGFLVETPVTIEGNYNFSFYPTAGQIRITGANGTRLLITFNANTTVTVELDNGSGTYAEIAGSPFFYYEL